MKMKLPAFALLALVTLPSAGHAALITKGSEITEARKAFVADQYAKSGMEMRPTTTDTELDFRTVDEGVLVLSHSTKTGLVTGLLYTLTDERPKSTRKTFDFEVESFDTTTGRLVLKTKSPGATSPSDLRSLVGKQVHLEGLFSGPGKLADYVVVPGGQVYLFDPVMDEGAKLAYGSTIAVDGVLGYHSYAPSPSKGAANEAVIARPPDHYYIESPKVRTNPVVTLIVGAREFRTWNDQKLPKTTSDEVFGVLSRFAGAFKSAARDCRVPEQGPKAALSPTHVVTFTNAANETVSVVLFVFSEKYSVLQLEIDSKPKRFFQSVDKELIGEFSKIMEKSSGTPGK